MKLAITQIVLGALVVVFAFIVASRAFPTTFTLPADESGVVTVVEVFPHLTFAHISVFLTQALGLAVLGCGIAQLIKARALKKATAL
ncbi:MAG: hypothetical protein NT134_04140 [Chloroflexi bacterium]|nr:hypothetical protein [Chloroflexota bacterium]